MLLRQCLQELRLRRGEMDALITASQASGSTVAPGATQSSTTEIPVVTARGLQDGRQFAVPRLARASDSAQVKLALAA